MELSDLPEQERVRWSAVSILEVPTSGEVLFEEKSLAACNDGIRESGDSPWA